MSAKKAKKETIIAKKEKKETIIASEKETLIAELLETLKLSADVIVKIAQSEKRLMLLKSEKLSAKCKVERQRARNLKFFRHEHTHETIAKVQKLSTFV